MSLTPLVPMVRKCKVQHPAAAYKQWGLVRLGTLPNIADQQEGIAPVEDPIVITVHPGSFESLGSVHGGPGSPASVKYTWRDPDELTGVGGPKRVSSSISIAWRPARCPRAPQARAAMRCLRRQVPRCLGFSTRAATRLPARRSALRGRVTLRVVLIPVKANIQQATSVGASLTAPDAPLHPGGAVRAEDDIRWRSLAPLQQSDLAEQLGTAQVGFRR